MWIYGLFLESWAGGGVGGGWLEWMDCEWLQNPGGCGNGGWREGRERNGVFWMGLLELEGWEDGGLRLGFPVVWCWCGFVEDCSSEQ